MCDHCSTFLLQPSCPVPSSMRLDFTLESSSASNDALYPFHFLCVCVRVLVHSNPDIILAHRCMCWCGIRPAFKLNKFWYKFSLKIRTHMSELSESFRCQIHSEWTKCISSIQIRLRCLRFWVWIVESLLQSCNILFGKGASSNSFIYNYFGKILSP